MKQNVEIIGVDVDENNLIVFTRTKGCKHTNARSHTDCLQTTYIPTDHKMRKEQERFVSSNEMEFEHRYLQYQINRLWVCIATAAAFLLLMAILTSYDQR